MFPGLLPAPSARQALAKPARAHLGPGPDPVIRRAPPERPSAPPERPIRSPAPFSATLRLKVAASLPASPVALQRRPRAPITARPYRAYLVSPVYQTTITAAMEIGRAHV